MGFLLLFAWERTLDQSCLISFIFAIIIISFFILSLASACRNYIDHLTLRNFTEGMSGHRGGMPDMNQWLWGLTRRVSGLLWLEDWALLFYFIIYSNELYLDPLLAGKLRLIYILKWILSCALIRSVYSPFCMLPLNWAMGLESG